MRNFVERRGKLKDLDRSFDLEFWQLQPPKARFDATWELIVHAMKVKGQDLVITHNFYVCQFQGKK